MASSLLGSSGFQILQGPPTSDSRSTGIFGCWVFQTQICPLQEVFSPHTQSHSDSGPLRSILPPQTSKSDRYTSAHELHALASRSYAQARVLHVPTRAQRKATRAGPPPPPTADSGLPSSFWRFHRLSVLLRRCVIITHRQVSKEPPASVIYLFICFFVFFFSVLMQLALFFQIKLGL
jgi:hypothetical protein